MVWALGQTTVLSLLVLVAAVLVAGRKDPPLLAGGAALPATGLVAADLLHAGACGCRFFRRWMRRKLERNPIGWLEQRTWSGRLVTWGWFAVLISIYSTMLTDRHFFEDANGLQELMAWLLAGSMALSAAGSFRRERRNRRAGAAAGFTAGREPDHLGAAARLMGPVPPGRRPAPGRLALLLKFPAQWQRCRSRSVLCRHLSEPCRCSGSIFPCAAAISSPRSWPRSRWGCCCRLVLAPALARGDPVGVCSLGAYDFSCGACARLRPRRVARPSRRVLLVTGSFAGLSNGRFLWSGLNDAIRHPPSEGRSEWPERE